METESCFTAPAADEGCGFRVRAAPVESTVMLGAKHTLARVGQGVEEIP
jgi:hypothetical protein